MQNKSKFTKAKNYAIFDTEIRTKIFNIFCVLFLVTRMDRFFLPIQVNQNYISFANYKSQPSIKTSHSASHSYAG